MDVIDVLGGICLALIISQIVTALLLHRILKILRKHDGDIIWILQRAIPEAKKQCSAHRKST